jgi:hypothetical protein
MDRPKTAGYLHFSLFFLMILLSCTVVLEILGTPSSFSDVLDFEDEVRSSLFEGYSIPSDKWAIDVPSRKYPRSMPVSDIHELLLADSFFHPPLSHPC